MASLRIKTIEGREYLYLCKYIKSKKIDIFVGSVPKLLLILSKNANKPKKRKK